MIGSPGRGLRGLWKVARWRRTKSPRAAKERAEHGVQSGRVGTVRDPAFANVAGLRGAARLASVMADRMMSAVRSSTVVWEDMEAVYPSGSADGRGIKEGAADRSPPPHLQA